ncbi:unnamed protein product [Sphenostylis stenocarpa]|uniref:DNA (cytosine-5-)-methyltransferase n=1 Tax=Sphenostylis stenocarpa TaxID=92480 RepID=A0AA86RU85_9FABA|nr:unnamed protein product [Sphenostylis stenocarpa]
MQFVTSASFLATVYSDYPASCGRNLRCNSGNVAPAELLSFAKSQVDFEERSLGQIPKSEFLCSINVNFPFKPLSSLILPSLLFPTPAPFLSSGSSDTMAKPRASTTSHTENNTVFQCKKAKRSSPNPGVVGKPIPATEALAKWPHRYPSEVLFSTTSDQNWEKEGFIWKQLKRVRLAAGEDSEVILARCHYQQAKIDGVVFNLYDDAYVKAEDGKPDYIASIVEMFESVDNEQYFMARWFYRAEDTVIKNHGDLVDKKLVFLSDVKDDNRLDCIVVGKLISIFDTLLKISSFELISTNCLTTKKRKIPSCDYYYDMQYTLPYLTFSNFVNETAKGESDALSTISSESGSSGCLNAMSTGLCLGASLAGVKLITRWAVDINAHACKSLKLNHPETQVINEPAENFLELIKACAKLCEEFGLLGSERSDSGADMEEDEIDDEAADVIKHESEENHSDSEDFEVEKLLAVCHGDTNNVKKPGLYFKVRWMGYDSSDSSYDTWEPIDGLNDCKEVLKDFVTKGYKKKLLPLPGDANFICGGPPCQGVSGLNRFRNAAAPLEDIKNKQLIVYMDIIDFLKPKYVLMENVVDILKFSGAYLGRYAIGRLVAMNYQARLGMMAAGSYGLPQFRMRVFLWGALPTEKLPRYPLPTHEVVSRGFVPTEFEEITVAYDTKETCQLGDALLLEDAISDLPPVTNNEKQDERNYGTAARTDAQSTARRILYDHCPLQLNQDDYDRVCRIPQKKGANFRDLPGALVKDNKVEWDPSVERVKLDSGKPLVPDYAMSFVRGTSSK